MNSVIIFSILYISFLKHIICSSPDVDNKVKIPEALTPEQYQKVDKLVNNQEFIENEIKDQLRRLGELHSTIKNITAKDVDPSERLRYESLMRDDSMIYDVKTLHSLEAPVIFLEPPLILPKDQIKTDEEVEQFLKKSGLESESKDKSDDPYKITNIDDAKTSEKVVKSKISKLRTTREDMFKKMRKLSLDVPGEESAESEFNKLKEGLIKLDEDLKTQIKKLTQIEHVKAVLINKKGPGTGAQEDEEDLESREEEMEREMGDEEQEDDGGNENEDDDDSEL